MNLIQIGNVSCSEVNCVCKERNFYATKKINKNVIKKLFYDHFREIFPNNFINYIENYVDDNSIYIDVNKRYISLYYKRRFVNISYDYVIKNSEFSDKVIKHILFDESVQCDQCNKKLTEGKCFLNNNKNVICDECFCLCNSPTTVKYNLNGRSVCFHCLDKILNIDI
jgi:hypothetical protein